ncbi:transcriptional regulator GcvA [Rhodoferax aquaticus]|uniref:Transcriptional regulator GcvA n=1 Tax=Rhodoferax aquaticus TaxID=2527691 RepID=A0A515EUX1_9BURK|nr:transcriptional regulator GcvA [Rhodoferax aquaticus]QDL56485.1 transcriptional regulator GcvA [Rhodoferax aquaticus]
MSRRLPPLNAIRAFEAAARHGSFTKAAVELYVTQGAVSHQVKLLEQWLGLPLFERFGHSLTLTAQGRSYLPALSKALDAVASATERLGADVLAGPLRVTVLPSLASKWLMPRLGAFQTQYPEIDLHISTSAELHDFSADAFDVGIRSGLGRWAGLRADLIAHEALTPVLSPKLAATHALQVPADLASFTLLHDQPRDLWPRWLNRVGAHEINAAQGLSFSDAALVLQAAVDGHGIAMGRVFLAANDLAAGRLVQPFPQTLANDFSYWLVCPKSTAAKPRIAAFRTWLLAEAGASAWTG